MVLWLVLNAAVCVYVAFRISWPVLRWHATRKYTVLNDLKYMGLPPLSQGQKVQGCAVVAGGSLAGLVTARVLADYFSKVVIVEPETGIPLHGGRVGQRVQIHKYMDLAVLIFRKLFPGFDNQAKTYGIRLRHGWHRYTSGDVQYTNIPKPTKDNISASRVTLEKILRDLTLSYIGDNLETVHGVVTGVEASIDGTRISSVTVRTTSTDEASTPGGQSNSYSSMTIPTVFFADCAGPTCISSKLLPTANPAWGPFQRHGYMPEFEYSSAIITVPKALQEKLSMLTPVGDIDHGRWDAVTVVDALAPNASKCQTRYLIAKYDTDQIILGIGAWGERTQCKTLSQFIEIVHRCQDQNHGVNTFTNKRHAWIFEFLETLGQSIEDIDEAAQFMHFKIGKCQWTDFESAGLPSNFVAVGDSRMRVNPVHAQGVLKLATDVVVLNSTLRSLVQNSTLPSDFSYQYFTRELPSSKVLFNITRVLDYAFVSTRPQANETIEFGNWFRRHWSGMTGLAGRDPVAASTLLNIMGGTQPVTDIFHPWNVVRIYAPEWLKGWL